MDGFLPLLIILITASLSSKSHKEALRLEMCVYGGTQRMLSVNLLSDMKVFVFLGLSCKKFLPARGSHI